MCPQAPAYLYLQCNGAHQGLHSFPTRRSSDLKAFDDKLHRQVAIKMLSPSLAASPTARQRFVQERSEEHTSELQSHSDLVCRLLLEKKNKERQRTTQPNQTRRQLLQAKSMP